MTTQAILYHDGCNVCLDTAATFAATMPGLEIVDLSITKSRTDEARAAGVLELPSLLLGGKVFTVSPHSLIGH